MPSLPIHETRPAYPTSVTALIGLLALFFVAHATQAEPRIPPKQWQENANELMRGKTDKASISEYLGAAPLQCLDAGGSQRLCEWHLERKHAMWQTFYEAVGTEDRFSLICLLPTRTENDASNSMENACSVRPRHSNRRMFNAVAIKRKNRNVSTSLSKLRKELQIIAQSWLDEARTLEEMSRLIGSLPERCKPAGDGMQNCLWRTYFATYGHGTLAASIPIAVTKKVDLICSLTQDGSPRPSGQGCRAQVAK